jgi:hypothetical protein
MCFPGARFSWLVRIFTTDTSELYSMYLLRIHFQANVVSVQFEYQNMVHHLCMHEMQAVAFMVTVVHEVVKIKLGAKNL